MPIQVIGFGAGGHARGVIEILLSSNQYEIVGLLDPKSSLQGKEVLGVPVLGGDHGLEDLTALGIHNFFIGLGSVGDCSRRKSLYEHAVNRGMNAINAVHPSAIISKSAELGAGLTIMAGAIINASAKLGANVIINTAAVIEHDCVVEDHVHIATGARIAGGVTLHKGAHIGIGATIREGILVGQRSIIGAGAVVIRDVPADHVVVGVPARFLRFVASSVE